MTIPQFEKHLSVLRSSQATIDVQMAATLGALLEKNQFAFTCQLWSEAFPGDPQNKFGVLKAAAARNLVIFRGSTYRLHIA